MEGGWKNSFEVPHANRKDYFLLIFGQQARLPPSALSSRARLEAVRTGKGGKGHELREKVANTQAEVRKEKVPTEESD